MSRRATRGANRSASGPSAVPSIARWPPAKPLRVGSRTGGSPDPCQRKRNGLRKPAQPAEVNRCASPCHLEAQDFRYRSKSVAASGFE